MKPTLLILAAGMGSRYGGLKQIDGIGPNEEPIIEYIPIREARQEHQLHNLPKGGYIVCGEAFINQAIFKTNCFKIIVRERKHWNSCKFSLYLLI